MSNAPVPPQNLDAEESVIGAAMLSAHAIDACEFLNAADFYRASHGVLWEGINELHGKREPVDAITLTGHLDRIGKLREAGGAERVHEMAALVPAASNAAHYARIVAEMAHARRLIRVLNEATQAAWDGDLETAERIQIPERGGTEDGGVTFAEALVDFEAEVKNPPDLSKGVAPPFSFLERWQPGRLYIVGGYQKDGKTVFGQQSAYAAASNGTHTGFISLEMSWRDLRDRIISCAGSLPYAEVQQRRFSDERRYAEALGDLATLPLEIFDSPDLDVRGIRALVRKHRFKFLVIDHLHMFDWKDRRDLERIVLGVTNIAKEFDIPVMLLAQLKRPMNTDKAPRPTISMLRESGMIEALAAWVGFIYRHRDEHGLRTNEAELVVAANRFGTETITPMDFNGEYVRLDDRYENWRDDVV